ncbi:MAG: rhomboid family intramembrane serine protease [Desulfobacterales bacterium]|nr:rhomboid family intramembrane serine protease [Desulfobacterales bacterium]
MLIIPLTGKISWRNPPFVTIAVILINCLVWFVLQAGDTARQYEISDFYFNSGLADIEISHYVAYREDRLDEPVELLTEEELDDETMIRYFLEMQQDKTFQRKLQNEEIITSADAVYAEWTRLKTEYERKQSQMATRSYGFVPDRPSLLTSFTYMFMHASTGHLVGNMIFLWIVGCILEMGLGRIQYTVLYVIGGLFAGWAFWLIYMDSTIPLVGASGAIAGLMGAFAVLFGRKRVKIFYYLGFYFNYIKIPAFILLPIWLGKEFYQLFGGGASHVAYVAHIGGLVGGALYGLICLKLALGFDQDVIKDAPVDDVSPLIEKALRHIAELDMETGRKLLEQALAMDPDNIDVLTHLFNVYKLNPDDQKYHQAAQKLLFELSRSYNTYEKAHHIYADYLSHTGQPRLSPQLYIQLCIMFAASGHLDNAVKIITMLLKKVPDSPGVPMALLKLGRAYGQKGLAQKSNQCLQLICNKYPNSSEAQLARNSLQKK